MWTHTAETDNCKDIDVINKMKLAKSNLSRERLVPEKNQLKCENELTMCSLFVSVPNSGLEKDILLLIPCCLLQRKPMFGDA
jgi:hypothetical protein